MSVSLAPRAVGYVVAAGAALVAAVALQDAPLAALGIPPLVAAVVGLAGDARALETEVLSEVKLEPEVVKAGDVVTVTAVLESTRRLVHGYASLVSEGAAVAGSPPFWSFTLRPGTPVELTTTIRATKPGEVTVGPLALSISGAGGLLRRRVVATQSVRVRVRPLEESLRTLPRSSRVRVPAGDRLARSRGDGIELAEVRPEHPGERSRRVNWRATARRGVPHVTLRHPEQSTDVVLFADTFGGDELPRILEVAAAASVGYLARRDRVGLVCFGGVLDWVEAGSGNRQVDRIRSRLAATSPFFSYAWKTIERIPSRALPAGALVVAISPLRDERFTSAIAEVRSRGHEVIVVEVATPIPDPQPDDPPSLGAAALLARMERDDLRHRLWLRGIAVAPLLPSQPLEAVFASLTEVRRRMRPGARR